MIRKVEPQVVFLFIILIVVGFLWFASLQVNSINSNLKKIKEGVEEQETEIKTDSYKEIKSNSYYE